MSRSPNSPALEQQEALPDETEVVEETVAEVSEVPVGTNPVQVEVGEFDEGPEEAEEEVVAENPCQNHHCKHGKVCELDENNTPMCVCQDPTSCPVPIGEFEKVCSNDNKTFDSSCHFFATKCTLEGTKKGHKLHLDYIGPCKYIAPCLDSELTEFPLRMRDWLKNVLVTLYERDQDNNLLTEKQKLRVSVVPSHPVPGHLSWTSPGPRLAGIHRPIPRSRPPSVSPHPHSNECLYSGH
ncbi:SPARC isoform X1 [Pontoporia blainvillei]|uniref:SPARC n=1 Tax=Pontoporia blainvillei TaxID=48723 RepID=A0ABX0S4A5_PONBL|nr:SPARC isoform X1 [Pontoporia blainvillei]